MCCLTHDSVTAEDARQRKVLTSLYPCEVHAFCIFPCTLKIKQRHLCPSPHALDDDEDEDEDDDDAVWGPID